MKRGHRITLPRGVYGMTVVVRKFRSKRERDRAMRKYKGTWIRERFIWDDGR